MSLVVIIIMMKIYILRTSSHIDQLRSQSQRTTNLLVASLILDSNLTILYTIIILFMYCIMV